MRLLMDVLALAALAAPASDAVPGRSLEGHWLGKLKVGVIELRLALDVVAGAEGVLGGRLVSLDQGAAEIPLDQLTLTGSAVHLEAKRIQATYDGTMSADGSELSGEWKQPGGTFPLVLQRVDSLPSLKRPQEPQRPLPYQEE